MNNIDHIKTIFQIPLSWYIDTSRQVNNAYGVNFVTLKNQADFGGMEIGLDLDRLESWVKSLVGEEGSGTVKFVDGRAPDVNGNVSFELDPNRWLKSDANGNISFTTIVPVTSVDNITADANGNVSLGAITSSDVTSVGTIVGLDYEGEYSVASANHGHKVSDLDDIQDKTTGNWMFVKSINNIIKPDENGNINLHIPSGEGFLVSSVDGVKPVDEKGDVKLGAVRSIQVGLGEDKKLKPDANGNLDLKDYIGGTVKTVNNVEPDDDGNVDLGDVVYSVNGEVPVNGDVTLEIPKNMSDLNNDVGYTTNTQVTNIFNEGMKTFTHDKITDWNTATSNFVEYDDIADLGVTAGLSYSGEQGVCPTNHGHKLNDITDWDDSIKEKLKDNFVTIDTGQFISGSKRFTSHLAIAPEDNDIQGVYINKFGDLSIHGNNSTKLKMGLSTIGSDIDNFVMECKNNSGFIDNTITAYNGSIDITSQQGSITLSTAHLSGAEGNYITLSAGNDMAQLANPPSDGCQNEKAIATVGWVRRNGGVKSIDTDYKPDDSGNIDLKAVRTEGE